MENTQPTPQSEQEQSIFDELQPPPVYYSEKAITGFCVFFGVLFGAVLMAINLSKTPDRKGIWQVVVFALLFTVMQGVMPVPSTGSTPITFVCNLIGAAVIRHFFWNKYIGKNAVYISRSIIAPLLIGIGLMALVLAVIFMGL